MPMLLFPGQVGSWQVCVNSTSNHLITFGFHFVIVHSLRLRLITRYWGLNKFAIGWSSRIGQEASMKTTDSLVVCLIRHNAWTRLRTSGDDSQCETLLPLSCVGVTPIELFFWNTHYNIIVLNFCEGSTLNLCLKRRLQGNSGSQIRNTLLLAFPT